MKQKVRLIALLCIGFLVLMTTSCFLPSGPRLTYEELNTKRLLEKVIGCYYAEHKGTLVIQKNYIVINGVKKPFTLAHAEGNEHLMINTYYPDEATDWYVYCYFRENYTDISYGIPDPYFYMNGFEYICKSESEFSQKLLDMKKEKYSDVLGYWKFEDDSHNSWDVDFSNIAFLENEIVIDGITYPINQNTSLFFDYELFDTGKISSDDYITYGDLYIKVGGTYIGIRMYDSDISVYAGGRKWSSFVRTQNPGGAGSGGNPADVAGTYQYTTGTPNTNGSLTLYANGTWSYSGNKGAFDGNTGTFTVSGTVITIHDNEYGFEESYTLSANGNSVTWTPVDQTEIAFIGGYFGAITGITFTKS